MVKTTSLKVERLQISSLPPSDPETTTTTLDKPVSGEALTIVAAAMAKNMPLLHERFLADLRNATRRQSAS
jgi:hypothetical protein